MIMSTCAHVVRQLDRNANSLLIIAIQGPCRLTARLGCTGEHSMSSYLEGGVILGNQIATTSLQLCAEQYSSLIGAASGGWPEAVGNAPVGRAK